MEVLRMTPSFWSGKRVFLTGHTGFKGAWLSLWLADLGAKVSGYALAPSAEPNLFGLAHVADGLAANTIADVRDLETLRKAVRAADPQIVIHMAAQPLVRESYADPVGTYTTNVIGTVHLLEAVRGLSAVEAVVVVTTDKCYENNEWLWGYREIDRLGGRDPYSNSKACAEMVASAYRQSFFRVGTPQIATARAGNVIGGGDWSTDRLVPDIVRGCLGGASDVRLRNPDAVRPWQHVVEPLGGYLLLAERLASGSLASEDAGWNFGPPAGEERSVGEVAKAIVGSLGIGTIIVDRDPNAPHEATLLRLDCSKARARLGWTPKLDFAQTIAFTSQWYAAWRQGKDMRAFTLAQIREYAALQVDR
jgi:CDP-glucose 4,6-dehydratase